MDDQVAQAPVGNNVTYQGRLTDCHGHPSDGPTAFQFILYNAPTGGADFVASEDT